MPTRYTAGMNRDDAAILADRLGVRFLELPIEDLAVTYGAALADPFAGTEPNVAEENLQARIRGNLLMALSNKFGWLVLTTGNKSEMSVGYATLYGDMAGGFAVIKDVPIWAFHGDGDTVAPHDRAEKLFAAMTQLGGNFKLTTWVGDAHSVGAKLVSGGDNGSTKCASDRCDAEPEMLKWLFSHTLSGRP